MRSFLKGNLGERTASERPVYSLLSECDSTEPECNVPKGNFRVLFLPHSNLQLKNPLDIVLQHRVLWHIFCTLDIQEIANYHLLLAF